MARPTPVLPEVGSTIVPPGLSFPSRSACSIIGRPIRSLTDPPGFRCSSFASSVGSTSRPSLSSRTIGVPPTSSSSIGYSRAICPRSLDSGLGGLLLDDVLLADPAQQDERGCCACERQCDQRPERVLIASHERLRCKAQVLGFGPEDRRDDRNPDCSADLLARVDQAGGEA